VTDSARYGRVAGGVDVLIIGDTAAAVIPLGSLFRSCPPHARMPPRSFNLRIDVRRVSLIGSREVSSDLQFQIGRQIGLRVDLR
jgi:hypothetical protein